MAPTGKAYEMDWRVSNNSNVHIVNDREWFTNYSRFETYVISFYGSEAAASPTGLLPYGTYPIMDAHGLRSNTGNIGLLFDEIKLGPMRSVGKVWLKGHRKGFTTADPNVIVLFNATWPDTERARCQAELESQLNALAATVHNLKSPSKMETETALPHTTVPTPSKSTSSKQTPSRKTSSRYTQEEQDFLKEHHRSEYHFLQSHGLSIYDEDDREVGREILRETMQEDDSSEDSEENSFLADLERDPMSHVADRHFNEKELDWIERHFRHSGNFLYAHGLKAFDDDDAKEGKQIVAAILEQEAEEEGKKEPLVLRTGYLKVVKK